MHTRHETISDQLEAPEHLDQSEVEAATFSATATRTGKYWTATVHGLPDGATLHVQGSTWSEARDNALERTAELLAPQAVGIQLTPADPETARILASVREVRAARLLAEQAERDAVLEAARTLINQGWTTRDTGSALGLSHQRISQLVPRATT